MNTIDCTQLSFDPNFPPSEAALDAMPLQERLALFNELQNFVVTQAVDDIPPALATLGVLLTRKMRQTTELTGRKPSRAKKESAPAASDSDLF